MFTHLHLDHMGLVGWFRENYHSPIWMFRSSYEEKKNIQSEFIGQRYTSSLGLLFFANGGPKYAEDDENR